ncbi:hypothetical protein METBISCDRAFT_25130 [Metschnikowia bicuspidata]|uniref:Uncharacterized protein n=1 Tax=Metschnikowia bicuspidata TaxID=27322 RepID=A0A4P9Z815_9ASCO|nr:hypothetical protein METBISCDRAFT_25130 [Metschnikowia bicuspidata]
MVPPKKMSLQEFVTDETYGGSWADYDIDLASISVPIEKNRAHHSSGGYGSGRGAPSVGPDRGPPYIVKILHIPVDSDLLFIDDLFRSRFTKHVKGRVLVDPQSEPLRTGTVYKVAFVELASFADQNRVLKWQDLVYRGSRRLAVEVADFNDFQHYMKFNQTHEKELRELEHAAGPGRRGSFGDLPPRGRFEGRTGGGMPLDSIVLPPPRYQLQTRRGLPDSTTKPAPEPEPRAPPKPKPNPFGQAKPVDVLAHQQEIEKKVIVINNNTVKTIGSAKNPEPTAKLPKEDSVTISESGQTRRFTAAPIPAPIYGQKQSLARLLSSNTDVVGDTARRRKDKSPPPAAKPVVLKKRVHETDPVPVSSGDDLADKTEAPASGDAAPSRRRRGAKMERDGDAKEKLRRKSRLNSLGKRDESKSDKNGKTENERSRLARRQSKTDQLTKDLLEPSSHRSRRSSVKDGDKRGGRDKRKSVNGDASSAQYTLDNAESPGGPEADDKQDAGKKDVQKGSHRAWLSPQKDAPKSTGPDGRRRKYRRRRSGGNPELRTERKTEEKTERETGLRRPQRQKASLLPNRDAEGGTEGHCMAANTETEMHTQTE